MRPDAVLGRALRVAIAGILAAGGARGSVFAAANETAGWCRLRLGAFEITALSDGTLQLEADRMFSKLDPGRLRSLLAREGLSNGVRTSVNAFLVNTGSKLVLIDAGTGTSRMFGPSLGHLLANLGAAGYSPDQVDEIYVTHLHTDHIGGLTRDGRPAFPHAIVRADARETAFYLSRSGMNAAPAGDRADFASARAILEPYVAAKRLRPFAGDTRLIPGVRAVAAPGHTPGHTVYVVESGGERMVVWGDLMHVAAVQFPQPSATVQTDWNTAESAGQRRRIFARVAKDGSLVAAAHAAFPGIGTLRAEGAGYAWVPRTPCPRS